MNDTVTVKQLADLARQGRCTDSERKLVNGLVQAEELIIKQEEQIKALQADLDAANEEISRLHSVVEDVKRVAGRNRKKAQKRLNQREAAQRELEQLREKHDRLERICDELLNHCDKENGECSVCGKIVCDHNDPMHFHHDGCPSCSDLYGYGPAAKAAAEGGNH